MKMKNGDHCLLRVPGANDRVGIFLGKDDTAKATHVRVDVKFEIKRDWKKFDGVDKPHTYIARRNQVLPYPVVT